MSDPLILASSSPRRRDLLSIAGIPFEVHVPWMGKSLANPLTVRTPAECFAFFPEEHTKFLPESRL